MRRCARTGVLLTLAATVLFLQSACCLHQRGGTPYAPGDRVDLEPNDQRPIRQIEVADAAETALLEQELGLEPLRQDGATLYYFAGEGLEARLSELGYVPRPADPYAVFQRTLRIDREGDENDLLEAGVRLINREKDHWVVSGSIGVLRSLDRGGYRLRPLLREPRPREIRVVVDSFGEVGRLHELGLDVYSVTEGYQGGVEVYGGAFDVEIDRLEEAGFAPVRVSTVEGGGAS